MSKHQRPGSARSNYQSPPKQEEQPQAAAIPKNPTNAAADSAIGETLLSAPAINTEGVSSNPISALHPPSFPELDRAENQPANDFIGWKPIGQTVTEIPPRNGMAVYLSDKPEGAGVLAFWKKTRAFANATKKWDITGRWTDYMSGLPIAFEPKYWRERFV